VKVHLHLLLHCLLRHCLLLLTVLAGEIALHQRQGECCQPLYRWTCLLQVLGHLLLLHHLLLLTLLAAGNALHLYC
jgi:hypothetical protein